MKLTEWYPGTVKPVRKGVYQRLNPLTGNTVYSNWTGKYWHAYTDRLFDAKNRKELSQFQNLAWRGVAK